VDSSYRFVIGIDLVSNHHVSHRLPDAWDGQTERASHSALVRR
jgi:hypothetical protein